MADTKQAVAEKAAAERIPSPEKQKRIIIENIDLMGKQIKVQILQMIMMSVPVNESAASYYPDAIRSDTKTEFTTINLDIVYEKNPALITQIYNVIKMNYDMMQMPK